MQGIKVKQVIFLQSLKYRFQVYVKEPLPATTKRGGTAENTLFLLDLLRQQKRKENEEKKVKSFV